MPALGGWKLSQLLAEMMENCPRGAKKCILFPGLFLNWLPCQLPVLLARADLSDLKGLAEQADELWIHNSSEDMVAAMQQFPCRRNWSQQCGRRFCLPGQPPGRRRVVRCHCPRSLHSPGRPGRPGRPARLLASAFPTGGMELLRRPAMSWVPGLETRQPGVCQCRHSWSPSSYSGQHF
jgi:hypothetical protein